MTARVEIRVLLFAAHREVFGRSSVCLSLPVGTDLDGMYRELTTRESRMAELRSCTTFALNREVVPATTELHDGDEVALLQPVSGGQT